MGEARQLNEGLVKILIAPDSRKILGVQIIGAEASNLAHTVIPTMYKNGTLDDLLNMMYIHPALNEVIRDAARDARAKLKLVISLFGGRTASNG